jgi:predicted  nucleic acid-binding Zn-ribbon protein
MKKDIKLIQKRIAELQGEIKKIEQERIYKAGKIALSIFKSDTDFTNDNFVKLQEALKQNDIY